MPAKPQLPPTHVPALTPPGSDLPHAHTGARHYAWLWLALALVLGIGLAVIFALPALIQSPPQVHAAADPVGTADPLPRNATNQAMQDYLRLRARLELENASTWGDPEWVQAERAADQGARMLAQRQFAEAAQSYGAALKALQQLESERGARLSKALQAAQAALGQNRLQQAARQFELALAIHPENQVAITGLARTSARARVLQYMATAERAESAADLAAAATAYRQATLLDPAYEPPASALKRVSEQLSSLAFQDAMTRSLTALDQGRLSAAGKALREASALRPEDPAVIDAQSRLFQARQKASLDGLRRQANAKSQAEDWASAAELYRKALALDAAAGFARSGLQRAEQRLVLNRQFDHYLEKPERLYSAQPLANAEALLSAAAKAPANEPKLARKIASLQRAVALANTPVAVELQSDGKTQISIYHVGKLGAFTSRRLELLPGNYTVVGKRRGYRDIRAQLAVVPGKQNTRLMLRCEEVI